MYNLAADLAMKIRNTTCGSARPSYMKEKLTKMIGVGRVAKHTRRV